MTTASKQAVKAFITAIAAVLCTQMSSAAGMADPEPIVVWDGAKASYNFSTLTKKIDDNTYTLNLNEMNSVAADGSYVQIGSDNAKAAITITAVNDDASITNAFGTDGTVTVIMKYTDLPVSAGSNRALISLLDSQKYQSEDNSAKIGVCDFTGTGYFIWQGKYYTSFAGANFAATEQTAALTYSSTAGTAFYLDGIGISTNTGLKAAGYTTPCGIALGGVDTDGSSQFFAMTGMKIKAVAIFTSALTAEQIANYKFPSEVPLSDSLVSEINDIFGSEDEIDVFIADGAIITGDTTFNASTVRFHCNGSFELIPPEGNTAVLDFSDVTGGPVLKYTGFFPTVSGTTFTSNSIPSSVSDASSWKGTVWVRGAKMTGLNPDTYGNGSSTLRLSGCQGYFANGTVNCNVAIELENDDYSYGIYVDDGFSRANNTPNNRVVINTLKGAGAVWTGNKADNVLINVRDWSEFTGPLQFVNKILVLGEDIPAIGDFNVVGSIYICAGATLTATSQLRADGGIYVNGELSTPNVGTTYIREGTIIQVPDTGLLTLTNSGNIDDTTANYACIQGSGTLKLVSQGNYYRCVSTVNFPTNMIVQTELGGGFLLKNSGAEYTIGSFAGSGYVRSDFNPGDRNLRILQAKDTTYSGVFDANIDRVGTVTVAPGVSTAGTLTLSGTQTASNAFVIESGAKVNLTGTWVGATAVAGTFGGTGTLTGNLTLTDGATIKVDDASKSLAVSGSLTATGAITIELPEGAGKGMVITTGSKPDISGATFTTKVGGVERKLKVTATANGLKVGFQSLLIRIR